MSPVRAHGCPPHTTKPFRTRRWFIGKWLWLRLGFEICCRIRFPHHFPKHVDDIRYADISSQERLLDQKPIFSRRIWARPAVIQLDFAWPSMPQADEKPLPISSVNMASCLALGSGGSTASIRQYVFGVERLGFSDIVACEGHGLGLHIRVLC